MNSNNYRIKIKKGEIEFEVEGDKEFVKELFEEFKTEMESIPESKPNQIQSIKSQKEKIPPIYQKYSIKQLYKKLNLKTNIERILFFANWMLRVKNVGEFSIENIMQYFTQFIIDKPANPKRDFKNLVHPSKGYLNLGSKDGFYSLSKEGMQYFEEKLNKL